MPELVLHIVHKHLTNDEQYLLNAFLTWSEKAVTESDIVQAAIDDVLEEHGKRDIRTSICFCPFCLVVNNRYNPYGSLTSFRAHFKKEHLSASK